MPYDLNTGPTADTALHTLSHWFWRFAFACCMKVRRAGGHHVPETGPLIVVVNHVSHLDPVFVSVECPRRIGWLAREEFYRQPLARQYLHRVGAIETHRHGYARPALRHALARLRRGEAVGLFPEGEIMSGSTSVVHGGGIKAGAVLLAAHSGAPVLPVVIAGTQHVNGAGPWMPARWGNLWIRMGEPVRFGRESAGRAGRAAGAAQLEGVFRSLFATMQQEQALPEKFVP